MIRFLFIFLAAPLMAGAALFAQDTTQTATQGTHDFFAHELYPRWSTLTPQRLEADVYEGIRLANERIDKLLSVTPQTATFENSFAAYANATNELNALCDIRSILAWCNALPIETYQTFHRLSPQLSACYRRLSAPAMQNILRAAATAPQLQTASPEQKRCIELVLRSLQPKFSQEKQEKLNKVHSDLNYACAGYEYNLNNALANTHCLFTAREELAGVPPHVVDFMARQAINQGYATPEKPAWLITAEHTPQMISICKHATSQATRKRVWDMGTGIACTPPYDNTPNLERIMQLKHDLATLQGYQNYTQLRLNERITGNAEQALAIINKALQEHLPGIEAENAAMLRIASEEQGKKVNTLNPEDVTYYRNKLAAQQNRFNLAELRPYLEFEHTLLNSFDYFGELYGLRITEVPSAYVAPGNEAPAGHAEVWAPKIRIFAVHDAESGTHYGSFYLDAYKQPGNTNSACCQMLRIGTRTAEGTITMPHLAVMQLQLTPPAEGSPHLLTHLELRVLFHELGHILHMMLSHAQTPNLAAAYQSLDSIEIPSLMNERRAWVPQVLCRIAQHHRSGAPLPLEIAEKAAAQRTHSTTDNSSLNTLKIAKIDLELHLHYHEKFHGKNPDTVVQELLTPWLAPGEQGNKGILCRSKEFICFGYDSCFYAYPLAEIIAEEMFGIFLKHGINNKEIARHYRKCVLETGNSAPAQQIYRNFIQTYQPARF